MSIQIICNFYFLVAGLFVFHPARLITYSEPNMSLQGKRFANVEQARVSMEHTRILAPAYWCDELASIDVTSIARLQRMMCNHGCEVIGDTTPPLSAVMGVHRSLGEPTLQITPNIPTEKRWARRVILDDDDLAWEAQHAVGSSHVVTPESGVDTGIKVNFSHTPPELAIFAELPQANAIMAAGRLATRLIDVGQAHAPYLEQVERWWGMPHGLLNDAFNQSSLPISIPRLLAAGGKSASPLYGVENLSGVARFVEPSATRDSFVTKADTALENTVAVDFSYYRSAVRWVMSNALLIPGPAQTAITNSTGVIGFDVNLAGRVVVPNKALGFAVPDLDFKAPPMDSAIVAQTQKAISNAKSGRAAVIAGIVLENSDYLLSDVTRQRMGHIRHGNYQREKVSGEVHIRIRQHDINHAEAGVGLHDYCIRMLGANGEYMTRNAALMGRLSVVLESKKLDCSRQHCQLVAMLWDPTFKISFQHMCRNSATTMDDFVAAAPEDYPYDARISYLILKTRMKSVVWRIKELEFLFTKAAAAHRGPSVTISEVARCVESWMNFYSGKAAELPTGWRKVRAQVLAAYYAGVQVEGDRVEFPDVLTFLADTIARYARRRKREQMNMDEFEDADNLAAAADAEYEPEYKFVDLLRSIRSKSKWTVNDLMDKKQDHAVHDDLEVEEEMGECMSAEALQALYAMDELGLIDDLGGGDSYDMTKMTGVKAVRAKYYAHVMMAGNEGEFIRRFCCKDYSTFAEWDVAAPNDGCDNIDELITSYISHLERRVEPDAEEGEADVL